MDLQARELPRIDRLKIHALPVRAALRGRPSYLWRSLDGRGAATESRPYMLTFSSQNLPAVN